MIGSVIAHHRLSSRYAWRGSALLVVDDEGRAGHAPLSGFYYRGVRFLRDLKLRLNEDFPAFCSVAATPDRLEFAYVYPEGEEGTGSKHGLPFRCLDVQLTYEVHAGWLDAVLAITNRFLDRMEIGVGWQLSADYAGVTESAGGGRTVDAPVAAAAGENQVDLTFLHERLPFRTRIVGQGGVLWSWTEPTFATRVAIARQETVELRLKVEAFDCDDDSSDIARREERLERWFASRATLHAPGDHSLVRLTNDAVRDIGSLALLDGANEEEWLAPGAGVPLFLNLWGRDALTTGWQAATFDGGEMIASTLARLARLQGTSIDDERDEQPGRIINRVQTEPASRLGMNPFDRYYGDDASPFMFIIALGQLFAWRGDRQVLERYWPNVQAILEWAAGEGDRDGDGYVEYLTRSPYGTKHQGWKDSPDAVVSEDGSPVEPPIAVCEIQGYYFAALQFAAVFAVVLGHPGNGREIWRRAKQLKEAFNRDFWMDDEGYVAFGLDADKRPIRSITSNAGQCLTTGIVSDQNAARLVARMFQPDLFSGWGIRTLSTRNPSFNPLSYHLGTVWAVENGTIMLGLRRYGFDAEATKLATALYELAHLWDSGRIPECVAGYSRDRQFHPAAYVNANSPQAWNQSVLPIVVQSILGMRALASLNLLIIDPVLPEWIPEVTIKNVRVGDAWVSLRFRRDRHGHSHAKIIEKSGSAHLLRQPPLDSLSVGVWDRLGALVKDVLPL